ncbi:MAG: toll/interleukin-1 receptor domain-containing protein [Hyphomonas sp.]|nr:toll/interleukin-1 receptor domain-containing protein [Hyphomonas sp.]
MTRVLTKLCVHLSVFLFVLNVLGTGTAAAQRAEPASNNWNGLPVLIAAGVVMTLLYFAFFRRKPGYRPSSRPSMKEPAAEAPGEDIFISYRREDSADIAGRLYDFLTAKFGKERVFKDVDSVKLGFSFADQIHANLRNCRLALVIIGPDWLGSSAGTARRIDGADDFVRIEVRELLSKGIPVIPVFVRGATMPGEEHLPADIRDLVKRNGIQLRPDPDFHNDAARLAKAISELSS